MRSTIRAVILAAGLVGLGAAAQAAPVPASSLGATEAPIVHVQMMPGERRMMHRHMEHRMMRHRMMRHRMMRHERRMMHRGM